MEQDSTNRFVARFRQSDGTFQSIKEHLVGTSVLASFFAGKIALPSLGELIGLLHDIGKYSNVFQRYLASAAGRLNPDDDEYVDARGMRGKIDHSTAGAKYLWDSLHKKDLVSRLLGQISALCIASHHSGLIDCLAPNGDNAFDKRMSKPNEKTHVDEARVRMDQPIRKRVQELLDSSSCANELNQCLTSLSAKEYSWQVREFMIGLLVRFVFSALIDADRLDSAERKPNDRPGWPTLIFALEEHLSSFKVRNAVDEIRSQISLSCMNFAPREKGLFLLTVPTGGGKTLASLRFALHHAQQHQMDRIIYVVPYTSIIDQNAKVVRDIFDSTGRQIVLEHHSNLTPENDTWQSKVLAENWDAPLVYTTAVQMLETLFGAGTRGSRRMHQLANAVIIFDEVQTIPIRTVHLFNNAVNFLVGACGATVVFCTATQPLLDQVDVVKGAARLSTPPNMVQDIRKLFADLRRVDVLDERKPGGWTVGEIQECVHRELDTSGSVLVIVNTRASARAIYRLCRGMTNHVYHLSTSMCPAHRLLTVGKVRQCLDLDNPKPVICISTQLIEAGVDVDFGSVIRYLAGLDSIAQAAGRCNRNGRIPTGRVLVVNPASENLERLPEIKISQQIAERVLDEYTNDPASFDHDRISPAAMERFYLYYFFKRAKEMAYPVSDKNVGDNGLLTLLSTNAQAVEAYKNENKTSPPFTLRQAFKSAAEMFRAIDTPTEGVIVPYSDEGERIIAELGTAPDFDNKRGLLKQAQRYSVNMFPYEVAKLKEMRHIYPAWEGSDILCLDPRNYSDEFGASIEEVGQLKTLIA